MPLTAESASTTQAAALDPLLHHAALAPLDDLGWLRVTGSDRVRWLNGMVTNSISSLREGEGNYNFVLSAQGRIQGDLTAFAEPNAITLKTARAQIPGLLALLNRFIIMDDVELTDTTAECAGLGVCGPQAGAVLEAIGLPTATFGALRKQAFPWRGILVQVLQEHSPLMPRFEVWAAPEAIASLRTALTEAGAPPCAPEALEALRILEGTPRYGLDIRDRDLPQETNQSRALHFSKGCYLGQEIVERIRSRGQVHRIFTGFRLQGELPTPGPTLQADGKLAGELTSTAAVSLPSGPIHLALGYIRREALDRNAILTYPGGQAIATSLPFASELYERP